MAGTLLAELLSEAAADGTVWLAACLTATAAAVRRLAPQERRAVRRSALLLGLHVLLLPVVASQRGEPAEAWARLGCLLPAAMAWIGAASLLLFDVALPAARVRAPSIVRDLVAALATAVAGVAVASRLQFNLSGIVATSAVVTAVIGFSLQDTLGNVMGGIALQLDGSVQVGDWVVVNGVTGRVSEIRWRFTAIETRNWETVILPNGLLMKSTVLVLGRRAGRPVQLRRYVHFNVDFRRAPGDVIRVVDEALQATAMERVARDPAPHAVLMDLDESYARYAARYWLTDIAVDNRTDTAVRERIYFALRRAGIPLAIPARANFLTLDSPRRRGEHAGRDAERRLAALAGACVLRDLPEEERRDLAPRLRYAPFARGEAVTRQGAEAHWLYIIERGEVAVRVAGERGAEREIARLAGGEIVGEMSLMTGEPRSATVTALTDVECWRLDREAFQSTIRRRPQMAQGIARVLAERMPALEAARADLDDDARRRAVAARAVGLAASIRRFFGLAQPDHDHEDRHHGGSA